MNFISLFLFLIAAALIILLIYSDSPQIQQWYAYYQDILNEIEKRVAEVGSENKYYFIFTLFFLFLVRAFAPIWPMSFTCTLAGVIFPIYLSIPLNIIGIAIQFSVKYAYGKKLGPGSINSIIKRNKTINVLIEREGQGNPWMLAGTRLFPFLPINPISQIYGSMDFPFFKYLLISLGGYLPQLVSYTIIGRNVYRPLSVGFLMPLILVFAFAASTVFGINKIIDISNNRKLSNKKEL